MKKTRKMRGKGRIACMREKSNTCKTLMGKPEGKDHKNDLDLGRRIILKWI
jgi:hypothetical protein